MTAPWLICSIIIFSLNLFTHNNISHHWIGLYFMATICHIWHASCIMATLNLNNNYPHYLCNFSSSGNFQCWHDCNLYITIYTNQTQMADENNNFLNKKHPGHKTNTTSMSTLLNWLDWLCNQILLCLRVGACFYLLIMLHCLCQTVIFLTNTFTLGLLSSGWDIR